MPTYQYTCTACDHDLEAVQSFSDDPLTDCPECSGRLRKVFSAVGVVFKGSGFYRTDSRAAANGSKNGGSKTGDGPSGSNSPVGSGSSNGKSEKSSGSKDSGSKDSASSTSTTTSNTSSAA